MKTTTSINGTVATINIFDSIDEFSDFSDINLEGCDKIILNFLHIQSFNSEGLTIFSRFLSENSHKKMVYKNCLKIVVDQVNMLLEMIPLSLTIENIQIPYFCDKCDHEVLQFFRIDEFFDGKTVIIPEVMCDRCNCPADFDETPKQYFKFLKPLKITKKTK